ncbi:unnamed protein product [Diabrotica balteata]|uniref:Uncharacterized protein n=1 Tax=Diabrotica balteata TaxID=107213 RepID=A0A9N9SR05_DIABA|nr:unnamed protein product [Diabrotica balteata]
MIIILLLVSSSLAANWSNFPDVYPEREASTRMINIMTKFNNYGKIFLIDNSTAEYLNLFMGGISSHLTRGKCLAHISKNESEKTVMWGTDYNLLDVLRKKLNFRLGFKQFKAKNLTGAKTLGLREVSIGVLADRPLNALANFKKMPYRGIIKLLLAAWLIANVTSDAYFNAIIKTYLTFGRSASTKLEDLIDKGYTFVVDPTDHDFLSSYCVHSSALFCQKIIKNIEYSKNVCDNLAKPKYSIVMDGIMALLFTTNSYSMYDFKIVLLLITNSLAYKIEIQSFHEENAAYAKTIIEKVWKNALDCDIVEHLDNSTIKNGIERDLNVGYFQFNYDHQPYRHRPDGYCFIHILDSPILFQRKNFNYIRSKINRKDIVIILERETYIPKKLLKMFLLTKLVIVIKLLISKAFYCIHRFDKEWCILREIQSRDHLPNFLKGTEMYTYVTQEKIGYASYIPYVYIRDNKTNVVGGYEIRLLDTMSSIFKFNYTLVSYDHILNESKLEFLEKDVRLL